MIKKLVLTALAGFIVASLAAFGLRLYLIRQVEIGQLPKAVIVYCFHGDLLDPKCKKIESQTRKVLDKSFAVPLKEGRLVWQVLNYEEPENAHFKDEYKITATCIVLVDARSGQAATARNLQQRIWQLVDDKEAFANFMREEIAKALKGTPHLSNGEGTARE